MTTLAPTWTQRIIAPFLTAICLISSDALGQAGQVSGASAATLKVTTDARIELLAAVQALSSYNERTRLITRYDHGYKQRMLERFAAFRDHEAVTMFDAMSRTGFSFDGPPATMLHYGPPPALEPMIEVSDELAARAGTRRQLDQFMTSLRDFAATSKFMEFYRQEQPFCDAIVSAAEQHTAGIDPSMLEAYYGTRQAGYTIILAPLFHPGGFGPRIARDDGTYEIFSVTGPMGMAGDVPTFGEESDFRYLVWHEFSHSFVNPAVDASGDAVDHYASLFPPMRDVMRRQAYSNWRTCVYEHIVRAATCRFAQRENGDEAGAAALKDEQSRGFAYVEPLAAKLAEYEQQREQYPTFDSFFPQLLTVFDEAMKDAVEAPVVEWTTPAAGAVDVDPNLAEIVVQFSHPMNPEAYSFVQQSAETFPEVTGKVTWRTPRICVLPVTLKPGTRYWIGLNSGRFRSFASTDGIAAGTFILEFTTADSSADE